MHFSNRDHDRRGSSRFPIEREMRYKVLSRRNSGEAGAGRTINMSSSGFLFTTEHVLLPGRTLVIAVSWPARLNDTTPLKLVARGRVVRWADGQAAVEVQHHEFRTMSAQGLSIGN